MICFIGHTTKPKREAKSEPERNLSVWNGRRSLNSCENSEQKRILRDTSLPWEILESAYLLFNKKGFEKTRIPDICSMLDIKPVQFYKHFESLDEILEILWAR